MESKRRLRIRAVLDRWLLALTVIALISTLMFGWLAVTTHATPGTHTEERVTVSWSTNGNFDHQATVQTENTVFPVGTVLKNKPLYYSQVMPVTDGTFQHRYRASGDGALSITTQLSVVIRSTGEEDSVEYWRTSRQLTETRTQNVQPGETTPVEFSVNVSQVQQTLESIRSDLGSTPGTIQTAIVARVELNGTVNGQQVTRSERYRLPITFQDATYSFGSSDGGNQYEQRERVTVPNQYSTFRSVGSIVGLVLGLGLLVGLLYLRRQGLTTLSSSEVERLEYLRARDEYEEWITGVELPEGATPSKRAPVASLEDLVDLAIDTEERVLADSSTGQYLVVHDGVTYTYEPPPRIRVGDGRE